MIVLSPFAKPGYANTIHYTHSSTLKTMQEIFGVTPLLADAANATDLSDLFTVPLSGNITPTLQPTATPTSPVTPTVTITQTLTPVVTCRPRPLCLNAIPKCLIVEPLEGWCPVSLTPTPTPTINPTSTIFSLVVCPHGLGKCGDNANPNGGGNMNPSSQQKTVTVSVFTGANQLLLTKQGNIDYSPSSTNFQGMIDMGNLANGTYLVKVSVPGYLTKQLPGIQTITAQQTNTLPTIAITTGDINSDNQLDILDYSILISCFGNKQTTASCTNAAGSDINDDGIVDGVDYNLFLRELSIQHGQ